MAIRPRPGKSAAAPGADTPLTVADLAERVRADEAALADILPVALAHVEEYAPRAPGAVRNEAVIRFAGYLASSAQYTVRRLEVPGVTTEFVTNHSAAFRNCGAAALLAPWRVRRAGVV